MQTKFIPNQPFVSHRDAIVSLIDHETEERVDRIEKEFTHGFNLVNDNHYTVTVFGSARATEKDKSYQDARQLGKLLANEGFAVVTGGGGGIMEAANRGAFEAGGRSIGLNIQLPHEQQLNAYTTESMGFHYFFARKVMLVYAASALVVFPGGFGTLDELFEVITLVQTGKMPSLPIILVGTEFWEPLDEYIRNSMLHEKLISPGDEALYYITDSLEEIAQIVSYHRDATSVLATANAARA